MIELTIKEYLEENLDVPVFLEAPEKAPPIFVVFEKTGSGKENYLKSSTFAFQSYGPSLYEAAKLNERVKRAVEDLISTPEFARVQLNSDYNFTDTETRQYRYQAVYDFNHY